MREKLNQPPLLGFEDGDPAPAPPPSQGGGLGRHPKGASAPVTPAAAVAAPCSDPHFGAARPDSLKDQWVILVDSHALIYQLFHALPPMTGPRGEAVAAVHGFAGDLLELIARFRPAYLFCVFDASEETFRNQLHPEYKAHREPMPDDLRSQLPIIQELIEAMGLLSLSLPGYEADDILATIAQSVEAADGRCLVVTSDKDCRQLITDRVSLYNLRKHEVFDAAALRATWGIRPDQVIDFQALVGDPVDNIPGVPLIGPKLARELLEKYDTLERILEHAHELSGTKRRENLMQARDQAMLSRELARLHREVPIEVDWSRGHPQHAQRDRLRALMERCGFRRLLTRTEEVLGPQNQPVAAVAGQWQADYRLVDSVVSLQSLMVELRGIALLSVDTETTGLSARGSDLVGISLAWQPGRAAYLPVRGPAGAAVLPLESIADALGPILADPQIGKLGQNIKFDMNVLRNAGLPIDGVVMDTLVADSLCEPGRRGHSLDDLAERYLGHQTIRIGQLIGTGRNQKRMDEVPVELVKDYAAEDADVPLRVAPKLETALHDAGLWSLWRDVELPLVEVLADLEFHGIFVDVARLAELSQRFAVQIEALESEIYALAGRPFNIDSPRQLAEILFKELGLPVVKKTKTGPSTDFDVLQQLAERHALPAKIVAYRQATKLKNTYVDALPALINRRTGRVHTSFRQDIASTGRLSSSDPNLQNIPIRSEDGRAIRSAFRAGPPNWLILTADYSQIELRVLAHYSGDTALCRAYQEDLDIHQLVAAEVAGIPFEAVTPDLRRRAKTINFGIVYGQSPFGLAKTLGISKEDAARYIEEYFARYPGVQQFMLDTIEACRREGFVKTMLGRRRPVHGVRDLRSLPPTARRNLLEPERIAVNTVIQGSAAELIKLAMLRVHRQLQANRWPAQMLLQIHDELLFEVAPEAADDLERMVRDEMVAAAALKVPLKVDVKRGPNWAACD